MSSDGKVLVCKRELCALRDLVRGLVGFPEYKDFSGLSNKFPLEVASDIGLALS